MISSVDLGRGCGYQCLEIANKPTIKYFNVYPFDKKGKLQQALDSKHKKLYENLIAQNAKV